MAGFKFKLDFLIKLRRRREEEAMSRLAQRLASIRSLEEELAEIRALKARLKGDLDGKIKKGEITIPLLVLYRDYDHKLGKDLAKLEEFLRLSRREEVKERAALSKASVDLKIMEKLKDRKKIEYQAEQAYLEQNTLEEMAALAKARRDREAAGQAFEEAMS